MVSPVPELDPATAVWTGQKLRRDGRDLAASAWDQGLPCSVVFFDVRPVKHMRDDEPRRAGEEAVDNAVIAWQSALPFGAILARSGRDEFIAVLPGLDVEAAVALNEHVRTLTRSGWIPGYALWTPDLSPLGAVSAAHDDFLAAVGRAPAAIETA